MRILSENVFSKTLVLYSLTLTLVRLTFQQPKKEEIKRKRRRTWVREIFKKRIEQGVYHNLLREIRVDDRESYFMLFV